MRVCVLCCYAGATSSMCVCVHGSISNPPPSLLREMTKLAPSSLSLRDTRTHTHVIQSTTTPSRAIKPKWIDSVRLWCRQQQQQQHKRRSERDLNKGKRVLILLVRLLLKCSGGCWVPRTTGEKRSGEILSISSRG